MHYQNFFLSALIILSIVHTSSTHAMNQKLQAKQAAMRQKLALTTQQNSANQIAQANTQATLIIKTKQESFLTYNKSFLDSCAQGNIPVAADFISSGMDVNTKDNAYITGLHFAAANNRPDMVQFLVEKGANVNAEDAQIMTPLHLACQKGYSDIARYLISKDANVNAQDKQGRTPMHFTSCYGHFDITTLLNLHGANHNQKSSLGLTPLDVACQKGNLDIIDFLTEDKTTINRQASLKFTPLHFACHKTALSHNAVSLLIAKGAHVNAQTINNVTPLHTACVQNNIDAVKILVDNGAYINSENDEGCTPLDGARRAGNTEIVQYLTTMMTNEKNIIKKQTTLSTVNPILLTQAILSACVAGLTDDIATLIKVNPKAVINAKDKHNNTALHCACLHKHLPIVKKLLEAGAEINAENIKQRTPLHIACELDDNIEVINYLLTYNKEIILQQNSTPLYAIKDQEGATPLHDVCVRGDLKAIELLLKAGADINAAMYTKLTPLHVTCLNGYLNATILLLNNKSNINAKTCQGLTPLHYACVFGHQEVVQCLLERGADMSIESADGITALELAYEKEKPAILKLFAQYGAKVVSEEEAEKCGKEVFAKLNHTSQTQQTKELQPTITSTKKQKRKNQQQINTKQTTPTVTDNKEEKNESTENIIITNTVTPETPVVPSSVTNNNSPTAPLKKSTAKQNAIEPEKKKPANNTPIQITTPINTNNVYHVVRPKKWPRHLVRDKSQINIMYTYLNELKKWPQTQGQGLDIETLSGKQKGFLCMRVMRCKSRVIFTVDHTNRKIIIDSISLHHDGYK